MGYDDIVAFGGVITNGGCGIINNKHVFGERIFQTFAHLRLQN